MKKRWAMIAAIVALLVIGHWIRAEYRFPNRAKPIESIQLLHRTDENSGDPMDYQMLRALSADEFQAFMSALYALDTKEGGTPPRWGYGEYIAQVTYANGDVEIFGTYCIGLVKAGQTPSGVGEYYFSDTEAFENLILQYTTEP